jgi:ferredoxin
MSDDSAYLVDQDGCIGCGACALLAPELFTIERAGGRPTAQARRPPRSEGERRWAELALLNCPASSIKRRADAGTDAGDPAIAPAPDVSPDGLYEHFARLSERVRWSLDDVAWQRLAPERASPGLRAMVREMAFSEHATYSATQRFMQTFADDVELTQWLSIWFYEETRHPHALSTWLRRIGAPPADEHDFVIRGRISTPFMKSKMGTLVTNVVSEVTAASAYRTMARAGAEPVLTQIAGFIAADEARHAASFLRFARRRLESAEDPARERLDALKVLHFWLNDMQQVTHPINQMLDRLRADATGSDALTTLSFDFGAIKRRVTRMIGLLVDVPLATPDDVLPELKRLTGDVQARRWGQPGAPVEGGGPTPEQS